MSDSRLSVEPKTSPQNPKLLLVKIVLHAAMTIFFAYGLPTGVSFTTLIATAVVYFIASYVIALKTGTTRLKSPLIQTLAALIAAASLAYLVVTVLKPPGFAFSIVGSLLPIYVLGLYIGIDSLIGAVNAYASTIENPTS